MNPFSSVVPPSMDVACSYIYISSSSMQVSSTVCSDPWNYYKGYGFDILLVFLTGWLVYKVVGNHR